MEVIIVTNSYHTFDDPLRGDTVTFTMTVMTIVHFVPNIIAPFTFETGRVNAALEN